MRNSMASRRSAIHDKSFAPRMAKAAIDCKRPEESADTELVDESVSLLLDVLDDLGVTPKDACDAMKIDRSKFTRIKTGEARPTFAEVWGLPDHVWLELRKRIDIAKGFSDAGDRDVRRRRMKELIGLLAEAM